MSAAHEPTSAPSRRLGRPKDVASAETHERLLDVARGLFARDGFDATTNKRIAAAAGITSGAIYHYYPSKAELYAAVYEQVQAIVYGAFEKAVIGHDTLRDRFGAVLDAAVETNRIDPSIAAFVVGVAGEAQRHPELRALLAPVRAQHHRFLHRLAADAAEREAKKAEGMIGYVVFGAAEKVMEVARGAREAAQEKYEDAIIAVLNVYEKVVAYTG